MEYITTTTKYTKTICLEKNFLVFIDTIDMLKEGMIIQIKYEPDEF